MKISKVSKGERPKASTINKLIDATRANTINEGRGSSLIKGGGGGVSMATPYRADLWRQPDQPHPWEVSFKTVDGVKVAAVTKGRIYDGLSSVEELEPTVEDPAEEAVEGDRACLEYTYDTEEWEYVIKSEADYEEITQSDAEPPILISSRVPLAKIEASENDPSKLVIHQLVRNNLTMVTGCIKGVPAKYLLAL